MLKMQIKSSILLRVVSIYVILTHREKNQDMIVIKWNKRINWMKKSRFWNQVLKIMNWLNILILYGKKNISRWQGCRKVWGKEKLIYQTKREICLKVVQMILLNLFLTKWILLIRANVNIKNLLLKKVFLL